MRKFRKEISLAFLNPELSKEWDCEKNFPLKPEDVFEHSSKKVWWKCKNGHKWQCVISERTSDNRKCSICNSLRFLNPELASEWDCEKNFPFTPEEIASHSKRKVWWKCKNGHNYEACVGSRNDRKHGCPYCSGRKACKENCLETVSPILSKEWNYNKNTSLSPKDVTKFCNKKVWWLCQKGHEYEASILHRSYGRGCPFCDNKKVCEDNCLAIDNPKLSKEWNYNKNVGITPENVICHSNKKVWWICKNNHEWMATIHSRNGRNGCPLCNKVKLFDGTICDSLSEAYYYLKLKESKLSFDHHVGIGLGKCICDFYIHNDNKYVEVTGYNESWDHWENYYKNIIRKQTHIVTNLKSGFEFVKIKLTIPQILYVREMEI